MTPEYLASLAAILFSLIASYLPGFSSWFAKLDPNLKRLLMLALIAVAAVGSFGVSCAGWGNLVDPVVACNQVGAVGLIKAFIAALIANQAAYKVSPKPS